MKGKSILMLLCAALAVSCVYDFEADLGDGGVPTMVIEGDILIGGLTKVQCSYSTSVRDIDNVNPLPASVTAYVLSDDGSEYPSMNTQGEIAIIDTRSAPAGARYKLVVENKTGTEKYETDWLEVHKAPVIDSLSILRNEASNRADVGITAHSDNRETYFKWHFTETWEYHSLYSASVKYVPDTGDVVPYGSDEANNYYCWKTRESSDVRLFTTENLTDDKFVDLEFIKIPRTDDRLSTIYYLKVTIESLSADAYRYWDAIGRYSNTTGDLFAPIPTEVVGNIRCTSDPSRKVIGFISASTEETYERYFDESAFYTPVYDFPTYDPTDFEPGSWGYLYYNGWRPFYAESLPGGARRILWTEARCVDCTLKGGTKTKPEGWPTTHR